MIRLEDLTKEYDVLPTAGKPGQVLATDRLNLEIGEKEIFGLVGPNGAGKTTTLKMVCGLLVPTAGRVTVNGIDVERQPEAAQKHIGYLADFFALYDELKTWEYLDYFAHAYKMDEAAIAGRIDFAIARMGLEPKRESYIAGLSRGMKQRVGIARAILHDPPVLVLDEPASGLDPRPTIAVRPVTDARAPSAPFTGKAKAAAKTMSLQLDGPRDRGRRRGFGRALKGFLRERRNRGAWNRSLSRVFRLQTFAKDQPPSLTLPPSRGRGPEAEAEAEEEGGVRTLSSSDSPSP